VFSFFWGGFGYFFFAEAGFRASFGGFARVLRGFCAGFARHGGGAFFLSRVAGVILSSQVGFFSFKVVVSVF
jgi:hypothetical protein